MDVERIRELRLAYPFKPFYLLMDDGKRYFVDKPYYLGIAPDGSRVGYSAAGNRFIFFSPGRVKDVLFRSTKPKARGKAAPRSRRGVK